MRMKTAGAAFIALTALAACSKGDVESADTTTVQASIQPLVWRCRDDTGVRRRTEPASGEGRDP